MARVWEWVVDDEGTRVRWSRGWSGRIAVHVNDRAVAATGKRLSVPLSSGTAELTYGSDWLSGPQCELRVGGKLLLPCSAPTGVATALRACLRCQGEVEAADHFCKACGKALPSAEELVKRADVRRGTSAIGYLSIAFAIYGLITYLGRRVDADRALAKIASYDASEPLSEPIPGVAATTVGELRTQIEWEAAGGLIVSLVLSSIMVALWIWGKRKPSAAIIVASCTYAALLVTNAALDPSSLLQGWIVKLIVTLTLFRGLKAAIALRGTTASVD